MDAKTEGAIIEREKAIMRSTPQGRANYHTAINKGAGGNFALYGYLMNMDRLRRQQEAMDMLDSSSSDYQ